MASGGFFCRFLRRLDSSQFETDVVGIWISSAFLCFTVQPSLLYRDAPRVSPHPHSTYVSTCRSWPRPCHYTTWRLFETRRLLPFFGSSPPATKRGRRLFDAGVYSRKYGTRSKTFKLYQFLQFYASWHCVKPVFYLLVLF